MMRRDWAHDKAVSALGFLAIMSMGFAAGVGVSYRIAWRWMHRPRPY